MAGEIKREPVRPATCRAESGKWLAHGRNCFGGMPARLAKGASIVLLRMYGHLAASGESSNGGVCLSGAIFASSVRIAYLHFGDVVDACSERGNAAW